MGTQGVHFLQCGDPTGSGRGGPGYWFDDELARTVTPYPAGVLAMANSGPNTNGSQFFVVYQETKFPPSYTQFGRLDEQAQAGNRTDKVGDAGIGHGEFATCGSASVPAGADAVQPRQPLVSGATMRGWRGSEME